MGMELSMNTTAFAPLTFDELMAVDGGSFWDALVLTAGCVLVAISPAVTIGGAMVNPLAGGYVGAGVLGFGLSLIDKGMGN